MAVHIFRNAMISYGFSLLINLYIPDLVCSGKNRYATLILGTLYLLNYFSNFTGHIYSV